ncbi:MAG: carboxypeptidase regulatory-like domain-containing protein [Terriglobales bacterium]
MKPHMRSLLLLIGVLVALVAISAAQSATTGQIAGVVKDPSGALVSGAKVTLTSSAGIARETTTGTDGHYIYPLLPPGSYTVKIEAPGFQTFTAQNVEVTITKYSEVDATLMLAGSSQTVEVSAAPPLVETSTATAGRVIDEDAVRALPLPTRNYTQILGLSPGSAQNLTNTTDLGRGDLDFNVNGNRDTSNNVVLDGTIIDSPGTNSTPSLAVPSPDSIQEFIVQTSLYDATQGRNTGGGLALVTKSGTNSFDGNLFEFLRNRDLNANEFFLNHAGAPRPELTRNQFGGTFGGPIRKDKTYFFLSYQGSRERNGASANSLTTLLIPEGLTNDRSTATLNTLAAANGVTTIDPTALALLQAQLPNGQYAIPSQTPNGQVVNGNVVTPISTTSRFSEDQFSVNIDHKISNSNKLTGKFFYSQDPQYQALFSFVGADPFQAPGYGGNITFSNRVFSLTDTHVFSPHLINEAHFGFSRINAPSTPQEPFSNAQFGINNPLAAQYPGLATIEVTGLFTVGSTPLGDQKSTTENFQWTDTVSYTHGKHFLRVGGDVVRDHVDFFFHSFSRGEIIFNDFPSFLSGTTAVGLLGNGIPNRNMRTNDLDWFAQEDYKATSRLTINAGVRVDFNGGISDTKGRIANFDPAVFAANGGASCSVLTPCNPPNGFVFFKPGQPLNPNRWLVSPRIGLSWKPLPSDNFVVRAGYGIYEDRFSTRFANFQIFNYPYDIIGVALGGFLPGSFQYPFPDLAGLSFPITPAVIPSPVPLYASGYPLTAFSTPISGLYADPNLRVPYTQQFNLGFQWELAKNFLADIGYVGSKGTKLINVYNFNQGALGTAPYGSTNFSNNAVLNGFEQVRSNTNSHYNSLQASLTKRYSNGLQFLASYTFSKSTDQGSGGFENELGGYPGDQQNPTLQDGLSDFNRTHRLVVSGIYDLPKFYSGNSRLTRSLANGWQVSGIGTIQSGLPFSVVYEVGSAIYNRADFAVPAQPVAVSGSVESRLNDYFNAAAFAPSANAAPFGDSGRNLLTGPDQKDIDFTIAKFIPVTEKSKIEFRTDFFNIFNFVNFSNPLNNLGAVGPNGTTAGQILTTSAGPRIIQFSLKYNF